MVNHKRLPDDVIKVINDALSMYLGHEICTDDISESDDEEWQFHVSTDWMYNNRGIFKSVISRYCVSADVIQHKFDSTEESYRNGNVYRVYPHIHWEHFNGGSNGHRAEPEMIIIEREECDRWDIRLDLR